MSEESVDLFQSSTLEQLEARIAQVEKNFGYHNHDGRNSLEIDAYANSRNIRLLSLTPFGQTTDGNLIITGGTTTLTRDMFYDHLTIEPTGILETASFRIFADIVEIKGGGIIQNNGNPGTAGAQANVSTAGVGGAATPIGSLPSGIAGGDGGRGGSSPEGGVDGDPVDHAIGVAGSNGGRGENGSSEAGALGGAGGVLAGIASNPPRNAYSAYMLMDTQPTPTPHSLSGGAGGGGGGGRSGGTLFGGGGGGGGAGGSIAIYARQIINSGIIQAKGGNGGAGGDTHGSNGGGGGAGGAGGVVVLVYGDLSGSGTIVVTGGLKGASFLNDAVAGLTGIVYNVQVSSLS